MPAGNQRVTAPAILKEAASHIGYRERSGNRNKFGAYFNADGTAWCAQFVSYCAEKAGADRDALFPETAWCPTILLWARRTGKIIRDPAKGDETGTPEPGDLMLVQRTRSQDPNYEDGAKHIGFVEKYLGDGWIQTIEGNTSNTGSATGNGVYRLKRKLTDQIVIVRPAYLPSKKKMITINGEEHEDVPYVSVKWINDRRKSGGFSRHIWYLQTWLSKISDDYKVTADGRWDDKTQAALDEFRRERVKIDGKLLKGSDAEGSIGITSLRAARDQAKSSKAVK